jgi:diguanylate cyclase (GGDEF)-like protein
MFGLLAAGALLGPARRLSPRQRRAFAAETLTVLAAGFMVVWYLVIDPVIERGAPTVRWFAEIGFPVGDLLLLTGVAVIVLRGTISSPASPLAFLAGGLTCNLIGDAVWSAIGVQGQPADRSPLATVFLVAAPLLMTLAALKYRPVPAAVLAGRKPSTWGNQLPIAAVAVGGALLLVVTVRENDMLPWGGLVIALIVMAGASAVRQMISLRDSRDLNVSDLLTGLANRTGLDQAIARAQRRHEPVAMLLIDLDGFKLVNDAYGHAAGDQVLTAFAHHLRATVRTGDTPARIGGDEFAVLLTDVTTAEQAVTAAQRILTAAAGQPIRIGDDVIPLRASIGIALTVADDTGKELLPLVNLRTGALVSAEALVRWQHATRGPIPPSRFIPIAERSGTIAEIGLYVLEQALLQWHTWETARPVHVSVNLSPRQLQEPTIVHDILAVLTRTGTPPSALVLEVTESAIVDEHTGIAALRALRSHGIRVAIDDFGTGYSSLQYLTRLPVDILKIDRSFVGELNGTPAGSAITEAVIRLAQVLNLSTAAEGIETADQAAELLALGCETGQGYHYAKPQSGPDLHRFIRSRQHQDA